MLASWLAARDADPRIAGADLRVEFDVALGTRLHDVARAKRTLERAGYGPGYDRWWYERWGGVAL